MVKKEKWFVNQLLDILVLIPLKSLTPFERIIVIALSKYADKNGFCHATEKNIEKITGILEKNLWRYLSNLKNLKILSIKRKWCEKKRMSKNFYTINLNAIIKLSINQNGEIEVENDSFIEVDPIKNEPISSNIDRLNGCTEIEPNLTVRDCSNIDKPAKTPVNIENVTGCTEIEPNLTVRDLKLTHRIKSNNPIEQKAFVQDKTLDTKMFDDFWACYPRKEKKKDAYKVWVKNKLDKIGIQILKDVIERQNRHDRWEDRAYIPLPTTYLNGEQWNDEIIERIKTPPKQNNQFLSKRESNVLDLGNEARALAARRNSNGRIS